MIKKLFEQKNIPFKHLIEDASSFKVVFTSQLALERGKHALKGAGHKIKFESRTIDGLAVSGVKGE